MNFIPACKYIYLSKYNAIVYCRRPSETPEVWSLFQYPITFYCYISLSLKSRYVYLELFDLPRCQISKRWDNLTISRLRVLMRYKDETSYRILKQEPGGETLLAWSVTRKWNVYYEYYIKCVCFILMGVICFVSVCTNSGFILTIFARVPTLLQGQCHKWNPAGETRERGFVISMYPTNAGIWVRR